MDENAYGYNGRLESIRKAYGTLPRAYLDNAAAPLFPHTLPKLIAEALCAEPLSNPHSRTLQSSRTESLISNVRKRVLQQQNCDPAEYELVFCANATAAAKLVGEALHTSHYAYLQDSHTSIVGLRELSESYHMFKSLEDIPSASEFGPTTVAAWPLQSNFDGRRYDQTQQSISQVHQSGGLVLLDVASYVATEPADLGSLKPDFAILSFYKMYGLPDLGALIVKKSKKVTEFLSNRRYFGGGTVAALTPGEQRYVARKQTIPEMLEDGTLPFHSILMLDVAMSEFDRLYGSANAIASHTKKVAQYCKSVLNTIPGCRVLAPSSSPIVSFILDKIGHNEFATAAALRDIHVRGGTLCNIGAYAQASRTDESTIIANHRLLGKSCNDEISFINGRPTGVVRVSCGPYSSYEDIDALKDLILEVTSENNAVQLAASSETLSEEPVAHVAALFTYPIKSCGGTSMTTSIVGETGLEHDREFCIVDLHNNKILSLKKHRTMALIKSAISEAKITVSCDRAGVITNPIEVYFNPKHWKESEVRESFLLNMDPPVVDFFSQAVGTPCTIAKQDEPVIKSIDSVALERRSESSLVNSSPLLLISMSSTRALELESSAVFRPNIIVEADDPWMEDVWSELEFPQTTLTLLGKCRRCNMVTVTADGSVDATPYNQLCKFRKQDGKIYFGQHAKLAARNDSFVTGVISVGDAAYEV